MLHGGNGDNYNDEHDENRHLDHDDEYDDLPHSVYYVNELYDGGYGHRYRLHHINEHDLRRHANG